MYELNDFGDTKPLRPPAAKMAEKDPWKIGPAEPFTNLSDIYDDPAKTFDERTMQLGEAADMYGNIGTVEEFGYVTRGWVYGEFGS